MKRREDDRHGMSRTRLYSIWRDMKQRCNLESCNNYKHYGALGVTYCEEWEHFLPFYEWAIQNGYSDDLTIDRIDVTGNYEPSNCRWANKSVQNANRRNNGTTEYKGVGLNSNGSRYVTSIKTDSKRVFYFGSKSKNECARKRNEYIIAHNLKHPLNEIREEYEDVRIPRDAKMYYAKEKETGTIISFEKSKDLASYLGLSVGFIGECINGTRNSKKYIFWKEKIS